MEIRGGGQVVVSIPRDILDSKDEDKDRPFVVYQQDVVLAHQEMSNDTTRVIQFEHPGGSVTVLGTHVIPEFGAAMLVMAACGVAVVSYRYMSRHKVLSSYDSCHALTQP